MNNTDHLLLAASSGASVVVIMYSDESQKPSKIETTEKREYGQENDFSEYHTKRHVVVF